MNRFRFLVAGVTLVTTFILFSCRSDDEALVPSEETVVITPSDEVDGANDSVPIVGFFLLNEANMGSNKASIDYFDYIKHLSQKHLS